MTARALLVYDNPIVGLGLTSGSISATGSAVTGYEPSKILDTRLDRAWQVPSGGPHTVTIDFGGTSPAFDAIALITPPGKDFTGVVTARLRNTTGGSDLWTSSTSVRPLSGLPDRRYFVLPSRTVARYLQIVLPTGSYLSYVVCGAALDLSAYCGPLKGWSVNDTVIVQENPNGARFASSTALNNSRRWVTYQVPLTAIPSTLINNFPTSYGSGWNGGLLDLFDRLGRVDPMMFLPHGESDTSQSAAIDLMHATSVYARLANDLELPFAGLNGSGQVQRNTVLSFETVL